MPVAITRPYLDGVPVNELRQLELAITPHGFLKAALASTDAKAIRIQYIGASDFGLSQFGRWVTIVSFTFLGKYKINGTINDRNLVELVGTWFPKTVIGPWITRCAARTVGDVGGVKSPCCRTLTRGIPGVNVAHNYYEHFRFTDVKPNAPVATMAVPDVVRNAVVPPVRVESHWLAESVVLRAAAAQPACSMDVQGLPGYGRRTESERGALAGGDRCRPPSLDARQADSDT